MIKIARLVQELHTRDQLLWDHYHHVLKSKLQAELIRLKELANSMLLRRSFVDSLHVFELELLERHLLLHLLQVSTIGMRNEAVNGKQ
jgi:hypothetical protein